MKELKTYQAKDCLSFDDQQDPDFREVIDILLSENPDDLCFSLNGSRETEKEPLVSFDYKYGGWCAGRYVGEAFIKSSNGLKHVIIKPRFGFAFFNHLIEEAFNIRLASSASQLEKKEESSWLKYVISLMWLRLLAQANRHGLPRSTHREFHKGFTVKGKLDVRKSAVPFRMSGQVVSYSHHKRTDVLVAGILNEAYKILRRNYGIAHIEHPEFATEAIREFQSANLQGYRLTKSDYSNLKLPPIYMSFKSVLDLSWYIIRNEKLSNKVSKDSKIGSALFIDIAELWELYLRKLLKKHFEPMGWTVDSEEMTTYSNQFYRRKIIPDIVMRKGADVVIWDAKYKLMTGSSLDVDRSDFFQIHTYLQAYRGINNVLGGGLLYPLSKRNDAYTHFSPTLFGVKALGWFDVNGIDISNLQTDQVTPEYREKFREREQEFLLDIQKVVEDAYADQLIAMT